MADMPIDEILEYLPHRYPFLLIDRVLECTPGKSLVALKNVTINEPFFMGHFPHRPVMPAVLILEAMAQATGLLALRSLDRLPPKSSMYYFVGVDNARFSTRWLRAISSSWRSISFAPRGVSGRSRAAQGSGKSSWPTPI